MASVTKAKAKEYAAWLLASNYIPFATGIPANNKPSSTLYNGILVQRSRAIGSKKKHPLKAIAEAGLAEHQIAVAVRDGGDAPKGWPGQRCLDVMKARKDGAAAQKAKAQKSKGSNP